MKNFQVQQCKLIHSFVQDKKLHKVDTNARGLKILEEC